MRLARRLLAAAVIATAAIAAIAGPAAAQDGSEPPQTGDDPWLDVLGTNALEDLHNERCLELRDNLGGGIPGGGFFDWFTTSHLLDISYTDLDNSNIKGEWKALDCERKLLVGNGALVPTEKWFGDTTAGTSSYGIPLTQYVMWVDDGSAHHLDRKAKAGAITWSWRVGVTSMRVAVWAVEWVATGRLTEIVAPLPKQIATMLDTEIVGPLRLRYMAMSFLGLAVGWMLVRRRTAEAAGTALFSIGALLIGGLLLANFDLYLSRAFFVKHTLNQVVMGIEEETGPPVGPVLDQSDLLLSTTEWDASTVTHPVIDATVHIPWQELNFGRQLQGTCEVQTAWIAAVAGQPSDDHWVRREIKKCRPDGPTLDEFNRRPTMARVFGAFLVGGGQVAIALLLLSTAVTAMASEVLLAAAFALLPLATAAAAFPGGRLVVQKWVEMLLKGILGFAVALVFLRVFILILSAIAAAEGLAMFERFALFALLALASWRARKMIPQAAQKVSGVLGGKVASAGSGGGSGGRFAAAAGGAAAGSLLGAAGSHLLGSGGMLSIARGGRKAAQVARTGLTGAERAADSVVRATGAHGKAARLIQATKGGSAPGGGLAAAATAVAARGVYNKIASPETAKRAEMIRNGGRAGANAATAATAATAASQATGHDRQPNQPPGPPEPHNQPPGPPEPHNQPPGPPEPHNQPPGPPEPHNQPPGPPEPHNQPPGPPEPHNQPPGPPEPHNQPPGPPEPTV